MPQKGSPIPEGKKEDVLSSFWIATLLNLHKYPSLYKIANADNTMPIRHILFQTNSHLSNIPLAKCHFKTLT